MIGRFATLVLMLGAITSVTPSPAAVNPRLEKASFAEDDLSGSGRELHQLRQKRANRISGQVPNRRALRLRIRVDSERAALAGVLQRVPATMIEHFPELPRNGQCGALLFSLVRASFEGRSPSTAELSAESGLAPEIVHRTLGQFAAAGLIDIKAAPSTGQRRILPKSALRDRAAAFVDRVWTMVDSIDLA
jgi:hypothetical protein